MLLHAGVHRDGCRLFTVQESEGEKEGRIPLLETILSGRGMLVCRAVTVSSLLPTDKTVKLWKVSERDKRPEGYNLKDEDGRLRDPSMITMLRVSLGRSRL